MFCFVWFVLESVFYHLNNFIWKNWFVTSYLSFLVFPCSLFFNDDKKLWLWVELKKILIKTQFVFVIKNRKFAISFYLNKNQDALQFLDFLFPCFSQEFTYLWFAVFLKNFIYKILKTKVNFSKTNFSCFSHKFYTSSTEIQKFPWNNEASFHFIYKLKWQIKLPSKRSDFYSA